MRYLFFHHAPHPTVSSVAFQEVGLTMPHTETDQG